MRPTRSISFIKECLHPINASESSASPSPRTTLHKMLHNTFIAHYDMQLITPIEPAIAVSTAINT